MKPIISIFLVLIAAAFNANAIVPVADLTLETVTLTSIPFEKDQPVRLEDDKGCLFYGSTKEKPLSGFFNEMLDRKAYFVEINQVVCDQVITKVKPVLIGITRPLLTGEKIRLPFIDVVVMTTLNNLESKVDEMTQTKDSGLNEEKAEEFVSKTKGYAITPPMIAMLIIILVVGGFIVWSNGFANAGNKRGKEGSLFKSEYGTIEFHDGKAITVNGLLISEFGYLLRYYSNGKLDHFDNLQAIAESSNNLIAAIDAELMADETREQQNLGVSRSTAIANLGNLRSIILTLTAYQERKK